MVVVTWRANAAARRAPAAGGGGGGGGGGARACMALRPAAIPPMLGHTAALSVCSMGRHQAHGDHLHLRLLPGPLLACGQPAHGFGRVRARKRGLWRGAASANAHSHTSCHARARDPQRSSVPVIPSRDSATGAPGAATSPQLVVRLPSLTALHPDQRTTRSAVAAGRFLLVRRAALAPKLRLHVRPCYVNMSRAQVGSGSKELTLEDKIRQQASPTAALHPHSRAARGT